MIGVRPVTGNAHDDRGVIRLRLPGTTSVTTPVACETPVLPPHGRGAGPRQAAAHAPAERKEVKGAARQRLPVQARHQFKRAEPDQIN